MQSIHPVILCGGNGTRLWPLSRGDFPKQLLPLADRESLLVGTLRRVADASRFAPPILLGAEPLRFLLAEHCRQAGLVPQAIVLEPVARNTAPALTAAALTVQKRAPGAAMLVLPSDHVVRDLGAFAAAVDRARQGAEAGWLTTFGMAPAGPETGYGYICPGSALPGVPDLRGIARFVEKPDAATAARLISEGALWNSGMFLLPAAALLEEVERHAPAVLVAARAALAAAAQDRDFVRLDAEAFARAPSLSIDVAVMERTDRGAVLPCGLGWSDVGSWDALWQISPHDAAGNAIAGEVVVRDAADNYLRSESRLLAVAGVRDLVVVETDTAVLVAPRQDSGAVKALVESLAAAGRREAVENARVYRPWGFYETLRLGPGFQVKHILVRPGAALSLQRHRHRAEHWIVVRGQARVTRGDETFDLIANRSTYISPMQKHRLANPGETELEIIEVQSGDYLGEDDIERFDDDYGRI